MEEKYVKYAHVASGLVAFLMVAVAFCALPVAKAEVDIGVGDYWEYSIDVDEDGMMMEGSFKLKVDSESTVDSQQVFILEISGSGDISGDIEDQVVSGSFDLTGQQTRLKADFSVLSEAIETEMSMSAMGMTVSGTIGFETEYDSPMDDYIGDDDMTLNSVVTTTTDVTEETWTSMLGFNESDSDTYTQTVTMTVVETNVTVDVPAGTFECCKVKVDYETDGYPDMTEYWYYSDEVGYYVKLGGSSIGSEGELELEDYSGKDGGLAGLFSGTNLLIMILIIVVVVVLIAVAIGMRSRRGRGPVPMPPPQPGQGVPPPSPPGEQTPPPPGYPPVG